MQLNLNQIKLKPRMVGAFLLVALIALVIGWRGLSALQSMMVCTDEISENRLPSVQSLLIMSEAQTAIESAEGALRHHSVPADIEQAQYKRFEEAEKRAKDARAIYEPLPQTEEEAGVWKEFVPAWDQWMKDHQTYVAIAKAYHADKSKPEAGYKAMEHQLLEINSVSFKKAEGLLNKLVELNKQYAKEAFVNADKVHASARAGLITFIVAGVVVACILGLVIANGIASPVNQVSEAAGKLAIGDLNVSVDVSGADEIGDMSRAMQKMIANISESAKAADKIADGDLTVSVKPKCDVDILSHAMVRMIENLTRFARDVQSAANLVTSGSEQMASSAQSLAQGATEQASSIEEISASMEEMNSTIKNNANNAQQTSAIAVKSAVDGQKGGEAVSETVYAMQSIADKINIIEEIARQTNMLALNAAIEAARAGEHGKGFAVVAAEVRKLAERSQTAAKEISSVSVSSVETAQNAGKILEDIVPGIKKTAELVQEISSSSDEQASGIEQVTRAITQLDQVIQSNSASTEELSSTAEELTAQAEQLLATAEFFKTSGIMSNKKSFTDSYGEFSKAA